MCIRDSNEDDNSAEDTYDELPGANLTDDNDDYGNYYICSGIINSSFIVLICYTAKCHVLGEDFQCFHYFQVLNHDNYKLIINKLFKH